MYGRVDWVRTAAGNRVAFTVSSKTKHCQHMDENSSIIKLGKKMCLW
jgi:hypothetical protein